MRTEISPKAKDIYNVWKPLLARVTGLEPATSGVTGRRSNQLSYTRSGRSRGLGGAASGVKPFQRDWRRKTQMVEI